MDKDDDTLLTELNDRHARLANAVGTIHARAAAARDRLPKLREQLGEALLADAMGEAAENAVNQARLAIIRAERDIEASELIIQPAHRLQTRIEGQLATAGRRQRRRREYEAAKQKLAAAGSANEFEARDLRNMCAVVNGNQADTADADAFLAELAGKGQEAA
jgi:hypothetical protein